MEWISVAERLPPQNERVMVAIDGEDGRDVLIAVLEQGHGGLMFSTDDWYVDEHLSERIPVAPNGWGKDMYGEERWLNCYGHVTHWLPLPPLPDPPEGEE